MKHSASGRYACTCARRARGGERCSSPFAVNHRARVVITSSRDTTQRSPERKHRRPDRSRCVDVEEHERVARWPSGDTVRTRVAEAEQITRVEYCCLAMREHPGRQPYLTMSSPNHRAWHRNQPAPLLDRRGWHRYHLLPLPEHCRSQWNQPMTLSNQRGWLRNQPASFPNYCGWQRNQLVSLPNQRWS